MYCAVTVYVPVHDKLPPTAIVNPVFCAPAVFGSQSSFDNNGSFTDTPVNVVFPVFSTTIEYVIT